MGMGKNEGELLTSLKNETGQSTVHRAKFLDEFVRLVPPEMCHFGKRLTSLEELDIGRVKLHFKDDSTAEADCVIGADGIHSLIRRYLLHDGNPEIEPQFTGSVAYRGLIPMQKAVDAVGKEYAENSFIWCGYGGCIMTYPVSSKSLSSMPTDQIRWITVRQ